jgi:hypothetical protein
MRKDSINGRSVSHFEVRLYSTLGGDRVDIALYRPVCFQFAQLFGEHALGNVTYIAFELVEAFGSCQQMIKGNTLPFAADNIQSGCNGAL